MVCTAVHDGSLTSAAQNCVAVASSEPATVEYAMTSPLSVVSFAAHSYAWSGLALVSPRA